MEQGAKYGIVKCLGQFRLQVVTDQQDVIALDVKPQLAVEWLEIEQFLQVTDRVLDPDVVIKNSFARGLAFGLPVRVLEAFPGAPGNFAENREMPVKSVQDRGRYSYR